MTLTAYNGLSIPSFMYGTAWKKQATTRLVLEAVAAGFTAIDTANQLIHYEEALVGEALLALAQQGISRDRLFLQTKFTPANGQDHRTPYDPRADLTTQVRQSFDSSLAHLHTDCLDSYVLHGPYQRRGLGAADWEVWKAIEGLYETGKVKMIGVSNVSAEQLALLCERASYKPMVVQNRCYAAFGWDKDVRELCRAHQIIYQGFSLLTANREVFIDPDIRSMAERYGVGMAQIVFRFAMQIGMLPLTGTTNPQHMKEDLQADRFTLTPDELHRIETIGLEATGPSKPSRASI
ncbi:MAG TPA: aldo/keto reductase [Nitrospiraceae bacterium]|nr:aldo/keto reductase [Nitrospiraceae bacterium]